MNPELEAALKELTDHINGMKVLKNYIESDAMSYEKQKKDVILLKQLNKKVKELL